MALLTPAAEFLAEVDGFFAAYFDASLGFQLNLQRLEEAQRSTAVGTGKSIAELDQLPFLYITGDPTTPAAEVLIPMLQGDVKRRNGAGGANAIFLARMLIVATYQIWEEHYRGLLAAERGVGKDEIVSDLFGDLRRYRQAIVHHRSIATANVTKNQILHWATAGAAIEPSRTEMRQLLHGIRGEVGRLAARV
jgi:hypothetical protein